MMSKCRWCTSVDDGAAELLQRYCSDLLSVEDKKAVNEDLCYCLECVVVYHRVRENIPALHKRLWELETSRLIGCFSQASELEDELCLVENDQTSRLPKLSPAEYAYVLDVPLHEILKYPYLMAHPKLGEMCVEAICTMEKFNSFQVFEKYPGIYLLLVNPNETVRRWAINMARSLGNVDRDDFYDLQEIFSCMFFVVELGISRNLPEFDSTYDPNTKMTKLPLHLYDSQNDKNYWLGICMLLTQLDTQAMDSLFLGPDKQANILQCILNTMESSIDDEEEGGNTDPFWPALQCFMVILDRLGSRVWGQIEAAPAFQAITGSSSYMAEIEKIRQETLISQVKVEPVQEDDMVTCSQMVYCSNVPEKSKKRRGRSSHGADGSVVYEEMNTLVNYLRSDLGQAMRVHNSTFLWFIPFIKSVMDLNNLIYSNEVIHYLYRQINKDSLNRRVHTCDKVSEFFTLILVHTINLHLESERMSMLYYCAPIWVEVVVKCATLPDEAFQTSERPGTHSVSSTTGLRATGPYKVPSNRAVPQVCMILIRSLLKEGSKMKGNTIQQTTKCSHFLDLLNQQFREGNRREWKLKGSEVKDLQTCLKQVARQMMDEPAIIAATHPIKEEILCDYGEVGAHDGRNRSAEQIDPPSMTKEPFKGLVTEKDIADIVAEVSQPTLQLSPLKPDPGKIQELKSKLSQLVPRKNLSRKSSVTSESRSTETSGSPKPSTSNSHRTGREFPSPPADSGESEQINDIPLSLLRDKLIKRDGDLPQESPSTSHKDVRLEVDRKEGDVIVISDDDYDDWDWGPAKKESLVGEKIRNEPSDTIHSPLLDSESEMGKSQVFEFELQDIVSACYTNVENNLWQEHAQTKKDCPVRPALGEPSTIPDHNTQPISDDDIERAMEQAEEGIAQQKKTSQSLKRAVVFQKKNIFVEPKPLPVKSRNKKPVQEERKSKEHTTEAPTFTMPHPKKADQKSDSTWLEWEARPSSSTSFPSFSSKPAPSSSLPAIVPPKKVRKAIEPESTVEKLGLKKKERKAFDLSQRSLVCVDKLRRYGQGVHVEQAAKKRHRKTKKTKTITPDTIVVPGGKKRLLPAQELQFLRQSRTKQQRAKPGTSAQRGKNAEEASRVKEQKTYTETKGRALISDDKEEDEDDDPLPCSQPDPGKNVANSLGTTSGNQPAYLTNLSAASSSTDKQTSEYFQKSNNITASSSGQAVGDDEQVDDYYDHDWMQYTQSGAVDMEICSEMAEKEDDIFNTQNDPVDMDIDEDSQEPTGGDDLPGNVQADQNNGFKIPSAPPPAITPAQNDDHRLLSTPEMSSMSVKNTKPLTTKIYALSSSRSASLVQEMERTAKAGSAVGRGRARPILPLWKPGTAQPQPTPQPTNLNQPQSVQMPPPKQPLSKPLTPTEGKARPPVALQTTNSLLPANRLPQVQKPLRTLPSRPVQVTRPFQTQLIAPIPQPRSNMTYPSPGAPGARQPPPKDPNVMLDPSTPIKHILRWTHDMFTNYKQFGAPTDLCAFPLVPVGTSFKSFEEYYKTFYPLLLINAFEELVTEWQKSSEYRKASLNLRLVSNEFCNGVWNVSFTAGITAHAESRQLYPKEDELVILWLPENTGSYSPLEQDQLELKAHFGCVHKSNVLTGGQSPIVKLIIKTRGNVTSVNTQAVRCDVVGSLVSTLREFRSLVSLNISPLNRPLLTPHISYFTPSEDAVLTLNLPEYNPDQLRAVKNGLSAIRNQSRGPKICLIHGPPGTGKSKTIVGLLLNLFSEGAQSMAPVSANRHSRARRLRVLLCAPSNAAIDNLMKKVIVAFKERCQNLNSPQGNCGDINLVRLGKERAISKQLADFSLDNRAEKAMLQNPDLLRRRVQLDDRIDKISREISCVNKDTPKYMHLVEEKTRLARERQALSSELKQSRCKKQEIHAKVLHDAHIICCTLSTSGSMVLESAFRRLGHEPFNCVIVDEAGQATETETLIPMLYRCSTLVLVGDPEQLPPTVISQKAKELHYGQSVMARLCKCLRSMCREQACPSPVVFLRKQYRMHPDICNFPSKHIYNKMLITDSATGEERCAVNWPFQPYLLFDVLDGREYKERDTYYNEREVRLVLLLLRRMCERVKMSSEKKQAKTPSEKMQVKVGVITPYNGQKERINREMAGEGFRYLRVEVDTVDGFQGREMDCIIVSCVRAGQEGIGFLANRQRMNVTITRAKCSLFILGHLKTLKTDNDWGALIDDASRRGTIINAEDKLVETASMKIFKPSCTLARSLSNPDHSSRTEAPSLGARHAPFSHRRTSHPTPSIQTSGCSRLPSNSSVSPPQVADRPTDPRLAVRPPQPPQQARPIRVPSARPQDRREDPRMDSSTPCPLYPPVSLPRVEALRESVREPQAGSTRSPGPEGVRSPRDFSPRASEGGSPKDPRGGSPRDPRGDGVRDPRGDGARDPRGDGARNPKAASYSRKPRGESSRVTWADDIRDPSAEPARDSRELPRSEAAWDPRPGGGREQRFELIREYNHGRGNQAARPGEKGRWRDRRRDRETDMERRFSPGPVTRPGPADRAPRVPVHRSASSPPVNPHTHAKGTKRSSDQQGSPSSGSKREKR